MDGAQLLKEIAGAWKDTRLGWSNCPFCEVSFDDKEEPEDGNQHDEGCLWLLLDQAVASEAA